MRITQRDIETLQQLREERASLERREEALRKRLAEGLREVGGSAVRGTWTISLVEYAGQPSWKNAFIGVAGEEAAARLVAAAPKHDRIVISKN